MITPIVNGGKGAALLLTDGTDGRDGNADDAALADGRGLAEVAGSRLDEMLTATPDEETTSEADANGDGLIETDADGDALGGDRLASDTEGTPIDTLERGDTLGAELADTFSDGA